MDGEFQHAVVIGRFQPFHNAHLAVVEHGLETADNVIVVIGSARAAPSTRNPWTLQERISMLDSAFDPEGGRRIQRIKIVGVRDYFYNNNAWLSDVQAKTDVFIKPGESVELLGSYKDSSSHYLKMFPQWEFTPVKTSAIDGTNIRQKLFERTLTHDWQNKPVSPPDGNELTSLFGDEVPAGVIAEIAGWCKEPIFFDLCKEYAFTRDYKAKWKSAPFDPVFVTADAIVTCSGHVLVIKRKMNPGKGLFALPGGFVKQQELIEDTALRELREETAIRIDKQILRSQIVDSHVFDYPTRSSRGRTITHGFHIKLKDGPLPEVKGGDDAETAFWMPFWDAAQSEEQWFEDHLHIIGHFVGAQGER